MKLKLNEIIGQERAKEQARAAIDSALRDDSPNRPVLIDGPSGTGKSMIAGAMEDEFTAKGWEVHYIADCGVIGRADTFNSQIAPLLTAPGYKVIFFDECQPLFNGQTGISPLVNKAFRSLVLAHGEEPQENVQIVMDGENHTVDFTTTLLGFLTNEPSSLESSASKSQGESPLMRRFNRITLDLYSHEDIINVIPMFLELRGLRAHESSQALIHNMHRGNMDAIKQLVDKYKSLFPDSKVMERGRVLHAARLTDYLPRGLRRNEGRLLRILSQAEKGRVRASLMSAMIGLKPADTRAAVAHLINQQKDGMPNPLVTLEKSYIIITDAGRAYIKQVLSDKFSLA